MGESLSVFFCLYRIFCVPLPSMKKKAEVTAAPKAAAAWFRWLSPLSCLFSLVAVGVALLTLEDDFLWKVQEQNLHLGTALFFRQQMVVPGGLLTWLGTWFTEFFYHPVLGVGWLCLWWAALMLLTQRAFRIPLKWSVLLLVPVALLLITCVDMGYWVYYLKLRGHFFVAVIGLCAVCSLVWAFRLLPAVRGLRPLFLLLSTAVAYPLIGSYALLAAVLMGIMAWHAGSDKLWQKAAGSVVALVAVIVVPLVYYRLVFYQTNIDDIRMAALPSYSFAEEYPDYYIPYYLLAVYFIALAAGYGRLCTGRVRKPLLWCVCHVVLLVLLFFGVKSFWYRDFNFHKELRMQRLMEQQDWQGIVAEAADQPEEPTRAIVMMRNLALFRLGRQGNEMYHYRTGAKLPATPIKVSMTQVVGSSIYFYYGMPNYCHRWCLEDGVEFGWRASYLKYMTRCALVDGEFQVARKYINLLKQTRYHRQWAEEQERFLDNTPALRADKCYSPVMQLMNFDDRLSSDLSIVEMFLMQHFITDPSEERLYQDQSMNAAMWSKDIATFWRFFTLYAKNHQGEPMPLHYQEAAYLYGHLENNVNISNMPFDESVKQTYAAFMQAAQNNARMGMTEEQMRDQMYAQFGKTFYYEYYLIRNQKLY
jgi:membrane protein YdbS with pleckstrin-like domain